MRILIIPDSFKENLSSTEVAKAIKKGIVNVLPEANIKEIPFSDGGEGALTVLQKYSAGRIVKCKTVNALGESIQANYFLFKEKKTAWIELSQASGLDLIPKEKRDPLIASTYGTGILIKNALDFNLKIFAKWLFPENFSPEIFNIFLFQSGHLFIRLNALELLLDK